MESPWEYFENRKHKKWNELSNEELNRLIIAIHILLNDWGCIPDSDSTIKEFLSKNLPIDMLPIKLK